MAWKLLLNGNSDSGEDETGIRALFRELAAKLNAHGRPSNGTGDTVVNAQFDGSHAGPDNLLSNPDAPPEPEAPTAPAAPAGPAISLDSVSSATGFDAQRQAEGTATETSQGPVDQAAELERLAALRSAHESQ